METKFNSCIYCNYQTTRGNSHLSCEPSYKENIEKTDSFCERCEALITPTNESIYCKISDQGFCNSCTY